LAASSIKPTKTSLNGGGMKLSNVSRITAGIRPSAPPTTNATMIRVSVR